MSEKEQWALLCAKTEDLYRSCLKNGVAAGDFLTPAEQAYLESAKDPDFPKQALAFFGGYDDAERRVAVFVSKKAKKSAKNDLSYKPVDWDSIDWEKDDWWEQPTVPEPEDEEESPITPEEAGIVCLHLTFPKGADLPDHRACLGTLMGMGLERKSLGDIVIKEDGVWLFCKSTVAPYLCSSLTKVGKSPVKVQKTDPPKDFLPEHTFEKVELTVSSLRADALMAAITGLSREDAKQAVADGLLRRNHLPFLRPEGLLVEGDLLSVTGKGRYRFTEIMGQTKKGRLRIVLQKYR